MSLIRRRCQYCDEEYHIEKGLADDHSCWMQYMNRYEGLCGLCGNSGWINTIGQVKSHAGIKCGINAPCICVNT